MDPMSDEETGEISGLCHTTCNIRKTLLDNPTKTFTATKLFKGGRCEPFKSQF